MFPIHLDLGFRQFYFYEGFYFIIAILLGVLLSRKRIAKEGLNMEHFDTFALFAILGAIIGGRLSNFIFWSTSDLIHRPWTFFFIWRGGISITGGIAGGIFAAWLYARKRALPFWDIFGMISPFILLSQALGRIGCFLNGDAHGTPTTLPWGVSFPRYGTFFPTFKNISGPDSYAWTYSYKELQTVTSDSVHSAVLHPTQIYELLLDLVLMTGVILLYKLTRKKGLSPKIIFFTHIGGYSLYRGLLEFIRADRVGLSPLGPSYMQLTLFGIFLISLVSNLLLFLKKKQASVKPV